ncbi:MAG: DUF4815 domain-containing protein [Bosea sp.]|nr:DUF4815 domain-containing protein [Bosea sp. (in: a-proteobacteria)]
MVLRENELAQAADINDRSTIANRRIKNVGNMVSKDGDRVEGCEINIFPDLDGAGDPVDPATMSIVLSPGRVYVDGEVLPVAGAEFEGALVAGERIVGVRLVRSVVTELEDVSLLGLHPGSEAEGEPGSVRIIASLVWALSTSSGPGQFFQVYTIKDGAPLDQSPPPALSTAQQLMARYDYDYGGNYIVDGCEVRALGKVGSSQIFSIAAGTANILGYKRIREIAMRHSEPEAFELESIAAEPHTFTGPTGGSTTITVARAPIGTVSSAVVVKRVTESVVRGASPGGVDALTFSSVVAVESVTAGATTYAAGTDFSLSADAVSWAPGGAEPLAGSTYSVTYRYNAAVTPTSVTDDTVTLEGGVNGSTALISYTSKLPRKDILCLDISGRPVYLKGIPARSGRLAPVAPANLLKLAEIDNRWIGSPVVDNNGTYNYTADEQRRFFRRLIDMLETFDRTQLEVKASTRDPVAKRGIFTDRFVNDFYRDQGAPQTLAISNGVGMLAIDDVQVERTANMVELLPWVEEVVIRQDIATSSTVINPYQNFVQMPAGMTLNPAVDFWTAEATVWTSDITREFAAAPNEPPGQTTINEVTEIRREAASTLRTIAVQVKLEGFGVGENLATLTMADVNVKPAGTQTADALGAITLTFNIPAGIPVGRQLIRATGAAGSFAQASFVGEGTIDITTMRRVTLITREAPIPAPVINNTTVINQVIIQQVGNPVVDPSNDVGGSGNSNDPLAQTFTLPEPRHVAGINFKITAVGNPTNGIRVQLATVANGYPTREVLAETFISMVAVEAGDTIEARFPYPVFCRGDREYCFVILTADGEHAVAMAKLGDVDVATQTRVSAQPYTVGVLLTSANRLTWTPWQEADLTFQVVCARFTATARTVNLITADLDTVSDIVVRGTVDLPTESTRFRYELVRTGGQVIPMAPGQARQFSEYLDEVVTLRAVLEGTETISPTLYPGTTLIGGRIRTSGTYITRAFEMGTSVDVKAIFAQFLPAGAMVAVAVDKVNNTWDALTLGTTDVLGDGWTEPVFAKTAFTSAQGRLRITLTGGPAARPSIAQMRGYSI